MSAQEAARKALMDQMQRANEVAEEERIAMVEHGRCMRALALERAQHETEEARLRCELVAVQLRKATQSVSLTPSVLPDEPPNMNAGPVSNE